MVVPIGTNAATLNGTQAMKLKHALLAATMLALPAARPPPSRYRGVYIAAGCRALTGCRIPTAATSRVGLDASDINPNNLGLTPSGGFNASFDMGFAGVMSVGYGFGNGPAARARRQFPVQ
jgi:OOP family OmpA-OmpF porin